MRVMLREFLPPVPGIGRVTCLQNIKPRMATKVCSFRNGFEAIFPAFRANPAAFCVDRGKVLRNGDIKMHWFAQAKNSSRAQHAIDLCKT
jgi:hypothetical protein